MSEGSGAMLTARAGKHHASVAPVIASHTMVHLDGPLMIQGERGEMQEVQ